MRRKISYVVLLVEVFAITILHIAKYKKEQPVEQPFVNNVAPGEKKGMYNLLLEYS